MDTKTYRFNFHNAAHLYEAEQTLHLAVFAAEGLFGEANVRMDLTYHVDEPRYAILIDGTNEVGISVVRMFTALLLREFGEAEFDVRRMPNAGQHPTTLTT